MPKFSDNEMFCKKCFLHDTFWKGGNSWGIDCCPICGSYETILWGDMYYGQKAKAIKLFDEWWKKERMS
jgi:hypothetical protein